MSFVPLRRRLEQPRRQMFDLRTSRCGHVLSGEVAESIPYCAVVSSDFGSHQSPVFGAGRTRSLHEAPHLLLVLQGGEGYASRRLRRGIIAGDRAGFGSGKIRISTLGADRSVRRGVLLRIKAPS